MNLPRSAPRPAALGPGEARSGSGGGTAAGGFTPRLERRARELLDAHIGGGITLNVLARACELSNWHFTLAFRQSTGMAPHQWLQYRRMEKAKQLLEVLSLAELRCLELWFCRPEPLQGRFRALSALRQGHGAARNGNSFGSIVLRLVVFVQDQKVGLDKRRP